jgi:positive regulator of sigma E activity
MSNPRGETLLEEGIVLTVQPAGGEAPGQARVHLVAGDHCDGCPASSLCKPDDGDRRIMEVSDPLGTAPGDRVRVMVPGGAVLRASFLVYGLPLLLLLVGVFLGLRIWGPDHPRGDLYSFFLGAGLAALAVPFAARCAGGFGLKEGSVLQPKITEILNADHGDPLP